VGKIKLVILLVFVAAAAVGIQEVRHRFDWKLDLDIFKGADKDESRIADLEKRVQVLESKELSMPTYEYQCTNPDCNHLQEEVHSMSNIPKDTKCEKCGKKAEKIFSRVTGIVEEGTKFYGNEGKF